MRTLRFVLGCLLFLGLIFFPERKKQVPVCTSNPQIPEKVLICGVCRNVEKAIPNTMRSISELGKRFSDYRTIIYENNSTDDTAQKLHAYAEEDPHLIFISEQLSSRKISRQLSMKIPHRTDKIARARNKVLDVAMQKEFDDFKYVIWADLDFLEPWSIDAIVETILHPEQEWDAVLANGAYDLFALRSEQWPIGFELIGSMYWDSLDLIRKEFTLEETDPWKKVYSAFGGLGIYKREAIRGCRYSGVVTKDLEKVVDQWLSKARRTDRVPFLEEYEALLARADPLELSGPLVGKRKNYPDELGVRLPKGKIVWFSCTKDATLAWTCEHIPFHASMIVHGHDRIFINPKIRCNP